jgi:predicted nucleic acid-binding Zn ribbon protein
MRKSNQQTIGEVLKQYLKENNLEKKLAHSNVIGSWETFMGKMVANHTKKLYFSDKTLFVELDSAALRNELSFRIEEMKKTINSEAGEEIVKEIVLK